MQARVAKDPWNAAPRAAADAHFPGDEAARAAYGYLFFAFVVDNVTRLRGLHQQGCSSRDHEVRRERPGGP
jgi:hypothetical protein